MSYNEQIAINGVSISDQDFHSLLQTYQGLLKKQAVDEREHIGVAAVVRVQGADHRRISQCTHARLVRAEHADVRAAESVDALLRVADRAQARAATRQAHDHVDAHLVGILEQKFSSINLI